MRRLQVRLLAWALAIVGAVVYGAYEANPALAIGSGVAIAAVAAIGLWLRHRAEVRVRKMVADVESDNGRAMRP